MSTPQIAYLDISPRQTGKTERLIQRAKTFLEEGRRVYFVTFEGLVEDMGRRLPGALILKDGGDLPSDEHEDAVWFYDEFDWLDTAQIRRNAFYATTPKRLREAGIDTSENDLLLRLIEAHGGRHCRYTWPFDMAETLKEARTICSPEEFRMWYLGEFLK